MSVLVKALISAVIIFGTGSYGMFYLFSDGVGSIQTETDNKNVSDSVERLKRSISINNDGVEQENKLEILDNQKLVSELRKEADNLNTFEEEQDEEEEEDDELEEGEQVGERLAPVDDTELRRKALEAQKELIRTLGYPIENTLQFVTDIPAPRFLNNDPVRTEQFKFENVERDPKFEESEIEKLDPNSVAKEFKTYLILAPENHELWAIKHKQLQGYLSKPKKTVAALRFGNLTLSTTKEQLAQACHNIFLTNPRVEKDGIAFKVDYSVIWNWCTLPKYWAQHKPTNWPQ